MAGSHPRMSYFAKHAIVEKKVVVTYFGKVYFTAAGLVGMLATDAAHRIMEGAQNDKKYGRPVYSTCKTGSPPMTPLERWKQNTSRLRKKFTRRAFPHIEKLFLSV